MWRVEVGSHVSDVHAKRVQQGFLGLHEVAAQVLGVGIFVDHVVFVAVSGGYRHWSTDVSVDVGAWMSGVACVDLRNVAQCHFSCVPSVSSTRMSSTGGWREMRDAVHHVVLEGHVEIFLEWLAKSCKSCSGAEVTQLGTLEQLGDCRFIESARVDPNDIELGYRVQSEQTVAAATQVEGGVEEVNMVSCSLAVREVVETV